ncbi:receptor-type tyrosine-protein phosphatase kappa, partial [Elysia marginata]
TTATTITVELYPVVFDLGPLTSYEIRMLRVFHNHTVNLPHPFELKEHETDDRIPLSFLKPQSGGGSLNKGLEPNIKPIYLHRSGRSLGADNKRPRCDVTQASRTSGNDAGFPQKHGPFLVALGVPRPGVEFDTGLAYSRWKNCWLAGLEDSRARQQEQSQGVSVEGRRGQGHTRIKARKKRSFRNPPGVLWLELLPYEIVERTYVIKYLGGKLPVKKEKASSSSTGSKSRSTVTDDSELQGELFEDSDDLATSVGGDGDNDAGKKKAGGKEEKLQRPVGNTKNLETFFNQTNVLGEPRYITTMRENVLYPQNSGRENPLGNTTFNNNGKVNVNSNAASKSQTAQHTRQLETAVSDSSSLYLPKPSSSSDTDTMSSISIDNSSSSISSIHSSKNMSRGDAVVDTAMADHHRTGPPNLVEILPTQVLSFSVNETMQGGFHRNINNNQDIACVADLSSSCISCSPESPCDRSWSSCGCSREADNAQGTPYGQKAMQIRLFQNGERQTLSLFKNKEVSLSSANSSKTIEDAETELEDLCCGEDVGRIFSYLYECEVPRRKLCKRNETASKSPASDRSLLNALNESDKQKCTYTPSRSTPGKFSSTSKMCKQQRSTPAKNVNRSLQERRVKGNFETLSQKGGGNGAKLPNQFQVAASDPKSIEITQLESHNVKSGEACPETIAMCSFHSDSESSETDSISIQNALNSLRDSFSMNTNNNRLDKDSLSHQESLDGGTLVDTIEGNGIVEDAVEQAREDNSEETRDCSHDTVDEIENDDDGDEVEEGDEDEEDTENEDEDENNNEDEDDSTNDENDKDSDEDDDAGKSNGGGGSFYRRDDIDRDNDWNRRGRDRQGSRNSNSGTAGDKTTSAQAFHHRWGRGRKSSAEDGNINSNKNESPESESDSYEFTERGDTDDERGTKANSETEENSIDNEFDENDNEDAKDNDVEITKDPSKNKPKLSAAAASSDKLQNMTIESKVEEEGARYLDTNNKDGSPRELHQESDETEPAQNLKNKRGLALFSFARRILRQTKSSDAQRKIRQDAGDAESDNDHAHKEITRPLNNKRTRGILKLRKRKFCPGIETVQNQAEIVENQGDKKLAPGEESKSCDTKSAMIKQLDVKGASDFDESLVTAIDVYGKRSNKPAKLNKPKERSRNKSSNSNRRSKKNTSGKRSHKATERSNNQGYAPLNTGDERPDSCGRQNNQQGRTSTSKAPSQEFDHQDASPGPCAIVDNLVGNEHGIATMEEYFGKKDGPRHKVWRPRWGSLWFSKRSMKRRSKTTGESLTMHGFPGSLDQRSPQERSSQQSHRFRDNMNVNKGARSSHRFSLSASRILPHGGSKISRRPGQQQLTFNDEFQTLEKFRKKVMRTMNFDAAKEHWCKNRYSKILPPDHSRVNVEKVSPEETDYYNAVYHQLERPYISAQTPCNPSLVSDFWRMVLQNKVKTIVLLCNCVEGGVVKCHQYWAESGVFVGAAVLVETLETHTFADFVIRVKGCFNGNKFPESRNMRVESLEINDTLGLNLTKNSSPDIVPPDWYRPVLNTETDRRTPPSGYINAVFVDGLIRRSEFIVTQAPLTNTVFAFWRMIFDYQVQTIVMLGPCKGHNLEPYFPKTGARQFQYINVEHVTTAQVGIVTVRNLKMCVLTVRGVEKTAIRHFHVRCWSDDDSSLDSYRLESQPDSKADLLTLIDLVMDWQMLANRRTRPIVVVDKDGASISGLFCACALLCERMRVNGEVDLYHTVKHMKRRRPQFISNFEQYRYLHHAIWEFLNEYLSPHRMYPERTEEEEESQEMSSSDSTIDAENERPEDPDGQIWSCSEENSFGEYERFPVIGGVAASDGNVTSVTAEEQQNVTGIRAGEELVGAEDITSVHAGEEMLGAEGVTSTRAGEELLGAEGKTDNGGVQEVSIVYTEVDIDDCDCDCDCRDLVRERCKDMGAACMQRVDEIATIRPACRSAKDPCRSFEIDKQNTKKCGEGSKVKSKYYCGRENHELYPYTESSAHYENCGCASKENYNKTDRSEWDNVQRGYYCGNKEPTPIRETCRGTAPAPYRERDFGMRNGSEQSIYTSVGESDKSGKLSKTSSKVVSETPISDPNRVKEFAKEAFTEGTSIHNISKLSRKESLSYTATKMSRKTSLANAATEMWKKTSLADAATEMSRKTSLANAATEMSRKASLASAATEMSRKVSLANAATEMSRRASLANADTEISRRASAANSSREMSRKTSFVHNPTETLTKTAAEMSKMVSLKNDAEDLTRRPSLIKDAKDMSTKASLSSNVTQPSIEKLAVESSRRASLLSDASDVKNLTEMSKKQSQASVVTEGSSKSPVRYTAPKTLREEFPIAATNSPAETSDSLTIPTNEAEVSKLASHVNITINLAEKRSPVDGSAAKLSRSTVLRDKEKKVQRELSFMQRPARLTRQDLVQETPSHLNRDTVLLGRENSTSKFLITSRVFTPPHSPYKLENDWQSMQPLKSEKLLADEHRERMTTQYGLLVTTASSKPLASISKKHLAKKMSNRLSTEDGFPHHIFPDHKENTEEEKPPSPPVKGTKFHDNLSFETIPDFVGQKSHQDVVGADRQGGQWLEVSSVEKKKGNVKSKSKTNLDLNEQAVSKTRLLTERNAKNTSNTREGVDIKKGSSKEKHLGEFDGPSPQKPFSRLSGSGLDKISEQADPNSDRRKGDDFRDELKTRLQQEAATANRTSSNYSTPYQGGLDRNTLETLYGSPKQKSMSDSPPVSNVREISAETNKNIFIDENKANKGWQNLQPHSKESKKGIERDNDSYKTVEDLSHNRCLDVSQSKTPQKKLSVSDEDRGGSTDKYFSARKRIFQDKEKACLPSQELASVAMENDWDKSETASIESESYSEYRPYQRRLAPLAERKQCPETGTNVSESHRPARLDSVGQSVQYGQRNKIGQARWYKAEITLSPTAVSHNGDTRRDPASQPYCFQLSENDTVCVDRDTPLGHVRACTTAGKGGAMATRVRFSSSPPRSCGALASTPRQETLVSHESAVQTSALSLVDVQKELCRQPSTTTVGSKNIDTRQQQRYQEQQQLQQQGHQNQQQHQQQQQQHLADETESMSTTLSSEYDVMVETGVKTGKP